MMSLKPSEVQVAFSQHLVPEYELERLRKSKNMNLLASDSQAKLRVLRLFNGTTGRLC